VNQEVKDLWTTALLSGEYEQGHFALEDSEGKLCCLGVLCAEAVKLGIIERREVGGTVLYGKFPKMSKAKFAENYMTAFSWQPDTKFRTGSLPPAVMKWAGLEDRYDLVDVEVVVAGGKVLNTSLSGLNDAAGWNFELIAEIIQEQL
jgi:hypothetical protein